MRDMSLVRRLSFAATFYPRSMPTYWESVASFGIAKRQSKNNPTKEHVHTLLENLEIVDREVFTTKEALAQEIVAMPGFGADVPFGIVLISPKECCAICKSRLYIRADRKCSVTIYDDRLGTLPATHFTKYCRKQGCSYQQHYSYSTQGASSEVTYDSDWKSLPYFMSSRETAFSVDMLQRLDTEIVLGQLSYK